MENGSRAKRFWGKADRQDPSRVHLLEHHLADVGACFEALLGQAAIRKRMARTAGLDDGSETGSGKTEAALWRFAEMYAEGLVDGMYFALPTRAAAVQIHERKIWRRQTIRRSARRYRGRRRCRR